MNSVKYALIHVLRVTLNEKRVCVFVYMETYHLHRVFMHIVLI